MNSPRYEILVEINGEKFYLDTYAYDPISLQYVIADVNSITTRSSNYSKTITIPETKQNRIVFQFISDLSVVSSFNPNLYSRCWVMVDSIPVIEGNIQLTQINPDFSNNKTEYELTIYGDTSDLFQLMGDSYISGNTGNLTYSTGASTDDIDFSDLDHTWDIQNITYSWKQDYTWGYYYPLIDYGNGWNLQEINGGAYIGATGATVTGTQSGTFSNSAFNIYPSQVDIVDMYPATYVKTIWDRIFSHYGFTYESEFLNSQLFKNLIIPFNGANMTSGTLNINKQFEVALQGTFSISSASYSNYGTVSQQRGGRPLANADLYAYRISSSYVVPYDYIVFDPNGFYNLSTNNYQNSLAPYTFNQGFGINIDVTFETAGTVTIHNSNNGYNGPHTGVPIYNRVTAYFYRDFAGTTTSQVIGGSAGGIIVYDFIPIPYVVNYGSGNVQVLLNPTYQNPALDVPLVEYVAPGVSILSTTSSTNGYQYKNIVGVIQSPFLNFLNAPNGSLQPLMQNEKVWAVIVHEQFLQNANGGGPLSSSGNGEISFWDGGQLTFNSYNNGQNKNGNLFYNVLNPSAIPGSFIDYSSVLPQQMKQKDFIYNIIEMFNLYLEPIKGQNNCLLIEPRDKFFTLGNKLDWTSKIDLNTPIQIQVLPQNQYRTIILNYTDDNDYLNTTYVQNYGRTYGYYEYDIDTQFSTDIQTIQPTFAPTPITYIPGSQDDSTGFIISRITKDNVSYNNINGGRLTGSVNKVRIMQKYTNPGYAVGTYGYGLLPIRNRVEKWMLAGNFFNLPAVGVSSSATFSAYPYAGHFDNPYDPQMDINFGEVAALYYTPESGITDNNLSTYYAEMINELYTQDSRVITVEMYLTPADINSFSFTDTIYLFIGGSGQYYRVNSISNYDPGQITTCQVELIKILN